MNKSNIVDIKKSVLPLLVKRWMPLLLICTFIIMDDGTAQIAST